MVYYLTENEFIDFFSYKTYSKFKNDIIEAMQKVDGYKENKIVFHLGFLELNESLRLHFEATLQKQNKSKSQVDNFEFINLVITNEIDFCLDRFNEARQVLDNHAIIKS